MFSPPILTELGHRTSPGSLFIFLFLQDSLVVSPGQYSIPVLLLIQVLSSFLFIKFELVLPVVALERSIVLLIELNVENRALRF